MLNLIVSDFDIKQKNSDAVLHKGREVLWFYKIQFELFIKGIHFKQEKSAFLDKFSDYFESFIVQKATDKLTENKTKIILRLKETSDGGKLRPLELMHYFRTIYVMLRFIDEEAKGNEEFYLRLMRSQLSEFELHMIAYNALSRYATKGGEFVTKRLIEKYALFQNMHDNDFKTKISHQFENGAFNKKERENGR